MRVLYKHKKQNKENVTGVVNKFDDLLSKCYEQRQVYLLPPSPSKLITTDVDQTLCSQSYYPVGVDVSLAYGLENLENLTVSKVFRV